MEGHLGNISTNNDSNLSSEHENNKLGMNLRIREQSKDEELDDIFLQGLGGPKPKKVGTRATQKKFEIQSLIKSIDILDESYLGADEATT